MKRRRSSLCSDLEVQMTHGKPSSATANRRTVNPAPAAELTPTEARSALSQYALLAELHAYRYAQAMSGRRYTAAARSERSYRRAAQMCRVLGELMRGHPSSVRGVSSIDRSTVQLPTAELARAMHELVHRGRAA
jgi:hypothetical protein